MDILGKQAEEAKQNVERVSRQVDQLESHLDAVDTALQDFVQNSREFMNTDLGIENDQVKQLERESTRTEVLESRIDELESEIHELRRQQSRNMDMIEKLTGSELFDVIEKTKRMVKSANQRFYTLQSEFRELEDRMEDLENEFVLETNSLEFDFERKLDRSEFEEERDELHEEISKLRASLNILSEDLSSEERLELVDQDES